MNNIQIQGLDQVIRELQKRGENVTNALETICNVGAEVIKTSAEHNAPGSIAGSILKKTAQKTKNKVTVHVGPSGKKFYAKFIEYGTKSHLIPQGVINGNYRRNIRHPGISRPRPFMRPAFDTKKREAQTVMGKKVNELVEE